MCALCPLGSRPGLSINDLLLAAGGEYTALSAAMRRFAWSILPAPRLLPAFARPKLYGLCTKGWASAQISVESASRRQDLSASGRLVLGSARWGIGGLHLLPDHVDPSFVAGRHAWCACQVLKCPWRGLQPVCPERRNARSQWRLPSRCRRHLHRRAASQLKVGEGCCSDGQKGADHDCDALDRRSSTQSR